MGAGRKEEDSGRKSDPGSGRWTAFSSLLNEMHDSVTTSNPLCRSWEMIYIKSIPTQLSGTHVPPVSELLLLSCTCIVIVVNGLHLRDSEHVAQRGRGSTPVRITRCC